VYCSHVLEHFEFSDLKRLLKDVHRILKPGGNFLISVPDASIYIDSYLGKISSSELLQYVPAVISSKKMDILNYIFYMNGYHKFMFDEDNLTFHLEIAGFVECKLREFNPTLDLKERDYESLYMVARKPSNYI
jgi:predicted SAM-dependent methyltransferase